MKGTMLAARAYDDETKFRLEEIDIPEIGDDDVLVKVGATGVTTGLLSLWQRAKRMKLLPATLGHEIAGQIVEVGKDVDRWAEGDRVRVHPVLNRPDNWSAEIEDGPAANHDVAVMGHAIYSDGAMPLYRKYHNGGLAEYVKVPHWNLDRLADHVAYDVASRVHSFGIAWRAFRKAKLNIGDTVVVTGATGATGGSAVLCAPHWGATKVIAVSRSNSSLARTAELVPGLIETISMEDLGDGWEEKQLLTERIMELTGGRGADAVIDFLPGTPDMTLQAIFGMRQGGKAVLSGGNRSMLQIPYARLAYTQLEIKGSGGLTRRDATEVLALVTAGRLDASPLFSHYFHLEQVNEAVETIQERIGNPMFVTVQPPSAEALADRGAAVAAAEERAGDRTTQWERPAEAPAAAAPKIEGGPEVGQTYEVEIVEEIDNQWTGATGVAKMGDVNISVPKAKVGERYKVKILSVGVNPWTSKNQAEIELVP